VSRLNESPFTQVLVTDTVPAGDKIEHCSKLQVMSVAPLFAEAIRAIHFNDSISRLFLPVEE
jgi:ribose-phosphate pyrophosphokinase